MKKRVKITKPFILFPLCIFCAGLWSAFGQNIPPPPPNPHPRPAPQPSPGPQPRPDLRSSMQGKVWTSVDAKGRGKSISVLVNNGRDFNERDARAADVEYRLYNPRVSEREPGGDREWTRIRGGVTLSRDNRVWFWTITEDDINALRGRGDRIIIRIRAGSRDPWLYLGFNERLAL